MVFGFMLAMGLYVLPEFSAFLPPDKQSASMRLVLGISDGFRQHFLLFGMVSVLLALMLAHYMKNNSGQIRQRIDDYFPFNAYKNFAAMKTLKTMGILVETRYNIHRAAVELKKHATPYIAFHLNHIIRATQFGKTDLGVALNSGLLSKRLMFRLKNAADSPNQATKKRAISIAADRSGDEAIRSLTKTKIYLSLLLWLAMASLLLLSVSAFMGVFSSLLNISYQ